MMNEKKGGWLELIAGGMFAGKSEELLRRVRRARYARQEVQVFKPALDSRYGESRVASHDGLNEGATAVTDSRQILDLVRPETEVIAIDEGQFFDQGLTNVCRDLADQGKRVIVAGLNLDALGRPFGPMAGLMPYADHIDTVHAICVICGQLASRTQLLQGGKPVSWRRGPLVLVGGQDEGYEARCRDCHEVPGKPRQGE